MRIRQHVNPLGLHFERFRGVRPALVADRPLEVEIGCADAQFLFERAARAPAHQYVGLEIREDLVAIVNRRARATRLPVHGVFCQAQLHMDEIFGEVKATRVFVNFPDPWFKRKHRLRRMVDPTLIAAIARITEPGAELFVQSDVWEIALDAMAAIEADPHFANAGGGEWTFWRRGNPYGVRSWREQNAEETGLAIWRIMYTRVRDQGLTIPRR
jgi:tRNA (guanine-N7-)-methyltransferase